MAIVDNQVTGPGLPGLTPRPLNVLAHWNGVPKASAANNVFTTAMSALAGTTSSVSSTQGGGGSTVTTRFYTTTYASSGTFTGAAGTQPDYPRNIVLQISASASSTWVTGGSVSVVGADLFQKQMTDYLAVSAVNSGSAGISMSRNFVRLDTISASLHWATGMTKGSTSSSGSDGGTTTSSSGVNPQVTLNFGVGQKLGVMPISILSSNAVMYAMFGTANQTTTSATASTSANQFTVCTGDYWFNGYVGSSAYNSGTQLELSYKMNGWQSGSNSAFQ